MHLTYFLPCVTIPKLSFLCLSTLHTAIQTPKLYVHYPGHVLTQKEWEEVKIQWSGGDCTFKISLLLNMVLPRSTAREAWPNQVSRLLDKPCMKLCIEWCLNKHWKSVCLLSRCLLNPGLCIIGAIYVNSERDLEFCHLNVQKNIWPYKIVTYFTRYLFAVQ